MRRRAAGVTESKDGPVNPPRPPDRRSAVPWVVLLLLAAWPFVSFLDHNRNDAPVYWLGIAGYGVGFVAFLLMVTALGGLLLGRARSGRIANTLGVGAVCLFNYLAMAGPLSQLGISLGTVKIASG